MVLKPQAKTEPRPWPISMLKELYDSEQVKLPQFQRGLVWGAGKRRDLINSIKNGLPIGSLLVWEQHDGTGNVQLIDGLQRTHSIMTYLRYPLEDFDLEWIDEDKQRFLKGIKTWVNRHKEWNDDLSRKTEIAVSSWLVDTKEIDNMAVFSSQKLLVGISSELEIDPPDIVQDSEVFTIAGEFLNSIKEAADINGYVVPVIVFTGEQSLLPDIFEKLNSTGIALTKYEKFAASWIFDRTHLNDSAVKSEIENKYSELEDAGFEVVDIPAEDSGDECNIYEYLFGLGKHLVKTFPKYFDKDGDTDSFVFSIAAVAHGLRLGEMADLPSRFHKEGGKIEPRQFKEALYSSMHQFDQVVKSIYDLKLNARSGAEIKVSIPEYQLASYISRLLVGRFQYPEFVEKPGWKEEWEVKLPKGIMSSFLLDSIRDFWRGSGDSKLYDRVWDQNSDPLIPSSFYLEPVTHEAFTTQLDAWFQDSLGLKQKERASIRRIDRLILRFIYKNIVTVAGNANTQFHIDHVLPISRLAALIKAEDGWPISNIANLVLLSKEDNQKKSTKTLGEFVDQLKHSGSEAHAKLIEQFAVSSVEDCQIPDDSDPDWYRKFLINRFDKLKVELLKSLET